MSGFSFAMSVVVPALSVTGALFAALAVIRLRELLERVTSCEQSLSDLSKLYSSSSSSALSTRLSECEESLTVLANRVKMQRVRTAANHADESNRKNADGLPDPYKDPDAWRNAVNSRLARGKFGLA